MIVRMVILMVHQHQHAITFSYFLSSTVSNWSQYWSSFSTMASSSFSFSSIVSLASLLTSSSISFLSPILPHQQCVSGHFDNFQQNLTPNMWSLFLLNQPDLNFRSSWPKIQDPPSLISLILKILSYLSHFLLAVDKGKEIHLSHLNADVGAVILKIKSSQSQPGQVFDRQMDLLSIFRVVVTFPFIVRTSLLQDRIQTQRPVRYLLDRTQGDWVSFKSCHRTWGSLEGFKLENRNDQF